MIEHMGLGFGNLLCAAASAALLFAQAPPSGPPRAELANTGAPMRIEYTCSDEDITAAGLDCTAEKPCPVYLELAAVESAGSRLFAAGNIHTESATLASVLLSSPDGGKTWTEPHERIRGASLDHLSFFDADTGWASGQLVQPLPRDPFLLLTTDAGALWRRRAVFSESRPGAIERFRFESRTSGTLWVDRSQSGEEGARFERWETSTGGEIWTLQGALNRLPPESPSSGSAEWRLRADPATRSYLLEHRSGDRWQTAAAFLIELGLCRPVLRPIPEPPPEPPAAEPAKTGPAKRGR